MLAPQNDNKLPNRDKLQKELLMLEKQLSFAKMDLSLRPQLYNMLVKSASHGLGAGSLKELLKTPNDMLTTEDLRRKINLISAEIKKQTSLLDKISKEDLKLSSNKPR